MDCWGGGVGRVGKCVTEARLEMVKSPKTNWIIIMDIRIKAITRIV